MKKNLLFLSLLSGLLITSCGASNIAAEINPNLGAGDVSSPIKPDISDFNYFDEENVTLSFGAVSDTHLATSSGTPTVLLGNVLDILEELNGNKPLTGLLIGGDMVDTTYQTTGEVLSDFDVFTKFIHERIDPEKTSLFYTMGNHDIDPTQNRAEDCENVPQYYYNYLGSDYFKADVNYEDYVAGTKVTGNRHAIINGYHFISVSPKYFWMETNAFTQETIDWLTNTLDAIVAENPNQPIFVTSHSAIVNTVRVSDNENNSYRDLEKILSPYHQVVYMAGHIHNLITDDLSIEQRDFTMIDLGSTKYSSAYNYIYASNYKWGPGTLSSRLYYDNKGETLNVGSGSYVEVDKHGNVKITRFMVDASKTLKGVVEEPWIIPSPKSDKSHLLKYRDDYRIENNEAPKFNENSRVAFSKAYRNADELVKVNITPATDDKYVEYYRVNVKTIYGQDIYDKFFQTHYYKYLLGEKEPEFFSFELGSLNPGTYVIEVQAADVWGALSEPITTIHVVE